MINTHPVMQMPNPPTMDKAAYMVVYRGIFEHSPWIVEQVWEQGLHNGSVRELQAAFSDVIRNADRQRQLALLRAHPQLACAIASGEELTEESRSEQRGAGLDQCSAREFELFRQFNSTYLDKFGFPFIIAVKGLGRCQILEFFRTRLTNSPEDEFREALEQVIRIGTLRLRHVDAKQEAIHDG